ncbi:MAG: sugar phosphate isomerase/epimerase [Ruminiclostridium sp.]|nr:sugar phosphate isomerase/epimerase [Ruminiclostridium sp.]
MNSIYFDPYVGTKDRYSAEEIIRAVAAAGYDGFNLPNEQVFHDNENKIKTSVIKQLSRQLGLQVYSILVWGPSLTDVSVGFDHILRHYRYIFDVCAELDILYISIWPGFRGAPKKEAFSKLVDNLTQLVPLAQREGRKLVVEFQPKDALVENVSQALELVDLVSPDLKITCDTTHLSNAETDLYGSILRLKPCLGDVHISGRRRNDPVSDPCDFDAIFKALKAIDYKGPFLVQYHLEDDISSIKESYLFTKELIRNKLYTMKKRF